MRRASRPAALVALLGATIVVGAPPASAWNDGRSHTDSRGNGRFVNLSVHEVDAERARLEHGDAPLDSVVLTQFKHAYACGVDSGALSASDVPCGPRNDPLFPPACDSGAPIQPLWYRERTSSEVAWGPWQRAYGWTCPIDHLPPFTAADFRRLLVAEPVLTMQPARGWVLVNQPTIVYSTDDGQTLHTQLLGHPVTVRATPTSWAWDYGDGHSTTTKSPGHAYPHQDVWHTYSSLGTRRIGLTVTWTAQFQYDEYPGWRDVDGTATTSATTAPFTVEERRGRLVAETCDRNPHAPGC